MRALVLRLLLRALAATWRVEVTGGEHLATARRTGRGFVFALWHHTLVPLLWWHRAQDVTLLVSRHADGDLVARSAGPLGYRVVRGSTARGGAAGLRGIVRALEQGRPVAVTPDGPRGPARAVKPGVLAAACRAGVPILPVAAGASSTWEITSWDRMFVPRPFARVRIAYGPTLPPAGQAEPGTAAAELARRLDAVSLLAWERL